VKPLRFSIFFFSGIYVLAVSQVSLAQPSALMLIYSLIYSHNNRPVGNTTLFLAWEGKKSDNVKSYQMKFFAKIIHQVLKHLSTKAQS